MELKKLKIEELVKIRTQMILEGKSTKTINRVIGEKEEEYVKYLLEDTSRDEFVVSETSKPCKIIVDYKNFIDKR